MVKNYYIFRHGQTFYSKFHLSYGKNDLTAKILPESLPSLRKIGKFLKDISSDYNVSSQFLRCRQSTEIIKNISGKNFVFDERLNEYHQVTFANFKDRISSFQREINNNPKNKTIIICTHGAVIAGLKHLILDGQFEESQLLDYPKTGLVLCIKDKKPQEFDFNARKNIFISINKIVKDFRIFG